MLSLPIIFGVAAVFLAGIVRGFKSVDEATFRKSVLIIMALLGIAALLRNSTDRRTVAAASTKLTPEEHSWPIYVRDALQS
jgi:hypothetical protein